MRAERVGLVSRIKELQDLGYYYDGRACLFVATKQAEKLDKVNKQFLFRGIDCSCKGAQALQVENFDVEFSYEVCCVTVSLEVR